VCLFIFNLGGTNILIEDIAYVGESIGEQRPQFEIECEADLGR
jgi:hypothetical protein